MGIEKAGPRVETTLHSALMPVCVLSHQRCTSSNVEELGPRRLAGVMMVRVCVCYLGEEGKQNIVTAWLDMRRRKKRYMCAPIFSLVHLSEFGIETGYLILGLPEYFYLRQEGEQNIVTAWLDKTRDVDYRLKLI